MVHGFPEWSEMYVGMMRSLSNSGYYSVACNMRGYSVGARPATVDQYHYDLLASDVLALATAFDMPTFHLVGHDHGACLSWYVGAKDAKLASPRVKSLSALSVPHLDAFSDGLYGPGADLDQQIASQYFTVFLEDDSASLNFNMLYNVMALPIMNKDSGFPDSAFKSAEEFQKALWWYNGASPDFAGVLAVVPTMSATELLKDGSVAMAALRVAYPADSTDGGPAPNRIGNVKANTLFICGEDDAVLLCTHEYSTNSKHFVDGTYEYLQVPACGHDILNCKKQENTDMTIAAVTTLLDDNN